jgi:hypothetical protein
VEAPNIPVKLSVVSYQFLPMHIVIKS